MSEKLQQPSPRSTDELQHLLSTDPTQQLTQQHKQNNKKLPSQTCQLGRDLLKQQKYLQASKQFSKSIMAFQYLLKNNQLTKQQSKQMFNHVMIPSYSNLSLCYLKMQNYQSVITFCNQILNHNNSHIKSRYRRGLAYMKLKNFDEAIKDLIAAGKMDPEIDGECQRLVQECKLGIFNNKSKERKMANAFISHINDTRGQKIQQQNNSKGQGKNNTNRNGKGKFMQFVDWICQFCKKNKNIKENQENTNKDKNSKQN